MKDTHLSATNSLALRDRFHRWLWLIPALLALLVNLNVLQNGFGWDDEAIISNLRPPDQWRSLFLPDPGLPKLI